MTDSQKSIRESVKYGFGIVKSMANCMARRCSCRWSRCAIPFLRVQVRAAWGTILSLKRTVRKLYKGKETSNLFDFQSLSSVGITGLEPATSRPPDVCATNCAKSRSFCLATDLVPECGCKITHFLRHLQILGELFLYFLTNSVTLCREIRTI